MAHFIFLDKLEFPRHFRSSETLLDARRASRKLPCVDMSVDAARTSARATKAKAGACEFHGLRRSETGKLPYAVLSLA